MVFKNIWLMMVLVMSCAVSLVAVRAPRSVELARTIPITSPFENIRGEMTIFSKQQTKKMLGLGALTTFISGVNDLCMLTQKNRKALGKLPEKYVLAKVKIHNLATSARLITIASESSGESFFNEVDLISKEEILALYPSTLPWFMAAVAGSAVAPVLAGVNAYNGSQFKNQRVDFGAEALALAGDVGAKTLDLVKLYGNEYCVKPIINNSISHILGNFVLTPAAIVASVFIGRLHAAIHRIAKPAKMYRDDNICPISIDAPDHEGITDIRPGCIYEALVVLDREVALNLSSVSLIIK